MVYIYHQNDMLLISVRPVYSVIGCKRGGAVARTRSEKDVMMTARRCSAVTRLLE